MPENEIPEIRHVAIRSDLQKLIDQYDTNPDLLISLLETMKKPLNTQEIQVPQTTLETHFFPQSAHPLKETVPPTLLEQHLGVVTQNVQIVSDQLLRGQPVNQLTELQKTLDEIGLRELGLELNDWVEWFSTKVPQLEGLSDDALVDKLKLWHRVLDYYLNSDPVQTLNERIPAHLQQQFAQLTYALVERQMVLLTFLKLRGIEKIVAEAGSRLIAGVIEISELGRVPTDNPELHNRVAYVAPGEGGFRYKNKIIATTYAHVYEYSQ